MAKLQFFAVNFALFFVLFLGFIMAGCEGKHQLEYVSAQEATCTIDGNIEHWHCKECGKNFSDESGQEEIENVKIEATGHEELVKTEAVSPICTRSGNVEYWTCKGCGRKFSDQGKTIIKNVTLPATHKFEVVSAVKESCEQDGNVEYIHCTVCGNNFTSGGDKIKQTTIKATGHSLRKIEAKSATCTEDGNNAYWICKHQGCGKVFSDANGTEETTVENEVLQKLGHEKEYHQAVEPTCQSAGNVQYWACSRCGNNFEEEDCVNKIEDVFLPPIKHEIKEVQEVPATCTEDGIKAHFVCVSCGNCYEDEEGTNKVDKESLTLEKLGHNYDGNYVCTVCGEEHKHSYSSTAIGDANGHTYEVICGHDVEAKTEEHTYNKFGKCTVCGYEHEHTYAEEYTPYGVGLNQEKGHIKKVTCGHSVGYKAVSHNYDNNFVCTDCGYEHAHECSKKVIKNEEECTWTVEEYCWKCNKYSGIYYLMGSQDYVICGDGTEDTPYEACDEDYLKLFLTYGEAGSYISLTNDISVTAQINITKSVTINLNEYTITNEENIFDISGEAILKIVGDNKTEGGVTVTLNGGRIEALENDCYGIEITSKGKCIINKTEVIGNIHAVYVYNGQAVINDGRFSIKQTYPDENKAYEFVLNCYDSNYKSGKATIVVYGGTFENFNPSNCFAEGEGTNFVADNHTVSQNENIFVVE